jgi:hypothetical protein
MAKRGVAGGLIKNPSQRDEVLSYMLNFGSISTFEAYTELGVTQLGARIKELEARGFLIGRVKKSVVSGRTGKTVRFVEYYIVEENAV